MLSAIIFVVLLSALGISVEGGVHEIPHHHIEPCLRACPKILDPVCALPDGFPGDPKTFGNDCELHNYNCENQQKYKFSYKGNCKPKCNDVCPTLHDPICAVPVLPCGFSGPKEFGNECLLELHNCRNPTQLYKIQHKGQCRKIHA